MSSIFETLNSINVNEHTEDKNGLTYLSWAWAWAEVKKHFPDANYRIYENADGWNYFTDGRTCWVKTGVIIDGLEHIEYLPVMDFKNKSITVENVTSFDVNKAIQRSLTKACARHGLGLYVYAGEDLPEDEKKTADEVAKKKLQKVGKKELATLRDKFTEHGINEEYVIYLYGYKKLEDASMMAYDNMLANVSGIKEKQDAFNSQTK